MLIIWNTRFPFWAFVLENTHNLILFFEFSYGSRAWQGSCMRTASMPVGLHLQWSYFCPTWTKVGLTCQVLVRFYAGSFNGREDGVTFLGPPLGCEQAWSFFIYIFWSCILVQFVLITKLTHFLNVFILLLYVFRATQCSSSGESNCINTSSGIYRSV